MARETQHPDRRTFLKVGAMGAAGCVISRQGFAIGGQAQPQSNSAGAGAATPLFNGKTLDGWIDAENSATSFSGSDILNLYSMSDRLSDTADPISVLVAGQVDDAVKTALAAYTPAMSDADVKAMKSALAKNLTALITGGSLYDPLLFHNVALRPETQALLDKNPRGPDLAHLNRLLLEDAYGGALAKSIAVGWIVKDGAISSVGAGRGVLYTANDYGRFRLMFSARHVSGDPIHDVGVLIWCTRPQPGEIPLDALGGIQFQPPLGGHWDYRPGKNNNGGDEFAIVTKPQFDPHEWSRVEILADAAAGTARMAVAQPLGSPAIEVLYFHGAGAGKAGPIALQMHNAGLFDEYKDITIEVNPASDGLKTLT